MALGTIKGGASVVKRVYQAVYAKLLAPENKVLRPDPNNMTPRAKEVYALLFPD
mgnify:CR=1 FL=1